MTKGNRFKQTLIRLACCCIAVGAIALGSVAFAQGGDPNSCDAVGDIPDVIVGELHEIVRNGTVGTMSAYSVGTTSCNVGTCWLDWFQLSNTRHPVIGAAMYRIKDGRIEQLGQSWLKHGFFALSGNVCGGPCLSTNGQHLGVRCSDPYSAGLNGDQSNLGPKDEVNSSNGIYDSSPRQINALPGANSIYKRLQVRNSEVDPAQNAGATYLVEGMYLFPDDAPLPDTDDDFSPPPGNNVDDFDQLDNSGNNSSYRVITINASLNPSFVGSTVREKPAILAWASQFPDVLIDEVIVPGDGRYFVGSRATNLGNGMWHYEYAVLNHTSDRSAGSFSVPTPLYANISNVGFRDVDYHSEAANGTGSWYDLTDWLNNAGVGGSVTWNSATTFQDNERSNALRWSTMYNFRFDADVPPAAGFVSGTIGMFKPGSPTSVSTKILGPAVCDGDLLCDAGETNLNCFGDCVNQGSGGGTCGDGTCNTGETPCSCTRDCGAAPTTEFVCNDGKDNDCDGQADCPDADCCSATNCQGADGDGDGFRACDCNNSNNAVWSRPSEVENLLLDHVAGTGTILDWDSPLVPGSTSVNYEVVRSQNAANLVGSTTCVPDGDPSDTTLLDNTSPGAGASFFYEVRATNACPAPTGDGELGRDSDNIPRVARTCP